MAHHVYQTCMFYLYVLGDILSLCSWYVCLCVGSWLKPKRNQPADEDDSGLKEALLGAVQCFTAILLPAHHTVVGLRTHRRHVCRERGKSVFMWSRVTIIQHYCPFCSNGLLDLQYSVAMKNRM